MEPDSSASATSLRIMTYNVHSCIGTDRQLSPQRIAEVIAAYAPEVVALQELDLDRPRSGGIDQAAEIAAHLRMSFHFHPAMRVQDEQYGHAILSTWPLRICHAGALPTVTARVAFEPRGALWVAAEVRGRSVQILNTHLGLSRRERLAQIDCLLGPEWLGSPACTEPRILCGDLNAFPGSRVYRRIASHLNDAQTALPGHRPRRTFPSAFPVVRLDYLFISPRIAVRKIEVPRTALTRVASDHLPLIADLEIA